MQPQSPTLGLTHLKSEAMLTTARASANHNDFSLAAMLGLLEVRILKATGFDIEHLVEEHGHPVLHASHGKGLVRLTNAVMARARRYRWIQGLCLALAATV